MNTLAMNHMSLLKRLGSVNFLSSRNINFVARARLLEKIKNDRQFCQEQISHSLFLPYYKGKPLLNKNNHLPSYLDYKSTLKLNPEVNTTSVALAVDLEGVPIFATSVGDGEIDTTEIEYSRDSKFTDLRIALFLVSGPLAHTLSKAWSLLNWNKRTNFCSSCGQPLIKSPAGSSISCSACSAVYYSPTSPVGIVSVSDPSTDSLLLIRQPRYTPGMYSCIAGFLDVGETLEECVRREVAEEVGLEVENVTYSSSQHWPFPTGSLMIGCHTEALPGQTPDPCKVELEDARWFSRKEVLEAKKQIDSNPHLRVGKGNDPMNIFIPPSGAIAYDLVSEWLATDNLVL